MDDGFDDLPAWALRFNFTAHSASGSARPNCKEFFEKAVARPQRLFDRAGCPATAGRVCETYAKSVIYGGWASSQAYRAALSTFDEHEVLDHVDGDAEKFSIIRDDIYEVPGTDPRVSGSVLELTCRHTAAGLVEATRGVNKIEDGRWISVRLEPDVQLDFIGQIDVEAGGVVEIKTRWPYLSDRAKRGWVINSLPGKPDPNHVCQVALYWLWLRQQSENVQVKLVYANCKGFRVFASDDCDQLSEASLNEALERLRTIARAREQMMQKAENIGQLLAMIAPDFTHYMWKSVSPEYRAAADKAWRTT
jgi:hypothetical protein